VVALSNNADLRGGELLRELLERLHELREADLTIISAYVDGVHRNVRGDTASLLAFFLHELIDAVCRALGDKDDAGLTDQSENHVLRTCVEADGLLLERPAAA